MALGEAWADLLEDLRDEGPLWLASGLLVAIVGWGGVELTGRLSEPFLPLVGIAIAMFVVGATGALVWYWDDVVVDGFLASGMIALSVASLVELQAWSGTFPVLLCAAAVAVYASEGRSEIVRFGSVLLATWGAATAQDVFGLNLAWFLVFGAVGLWVHMIKEHLAGSGMFAALVIIAVFVALVGWLGLAAASSFFLGGSPIVFFAVVWTFLGVTAWAARRADLPWLFWPTLALAAVFSPLSILGYALWYAVF